MSGPSCSGNARGRPVVDKAGSFLCPTGLSLLVAKKTLSLSLLSSHHVPTQRRCQQRAAAAMAQPAFRRSTYCQSLYCFSCSFDGDVVPFGRYTSCST